jgi:hypothetical protein
MFGTAQESQNPVVLADRAEVLLADYTRYHVVLSVLSW